MTGPRISVALATYNGARFLCSQLDSIAAQTRLPDELVIGDDGSADGTVEIIKEFAAVAPFPIRLTINEKNLGFGDDFLATAGPRFQSNGPHRHLRPVQKTQRFGPR